MASIHPSICILLILTFASVGKMVEMVDAKGEFGMMGSKSRCKQYVYDGCGFKGDCDDPCCEAKCNQLYGSYNVVAYCASPPPVLCLCTFDCHI
ncbi:hypothetical protein C2S51_017872 [Perilla frutescens var. frutescens]|nr:hypothetical protein C2S51_017872 [Perilla frutescens var. frutescens]